MEFQRNNLAASSSPYLRQHHDNPVWWQEWTPETLAYAKSTNKALLVSVGYSTCHWCHVMAAGAFSDDECARILNRDFVAIKVDREQRPDIDQYLMGFLVATTGSGGWPLNAFLTPDGRPFFAMTFAASEPRFGMPGLPDILAQVKTFYDEKSQTISEFELPSRERDGDTPAVDFVDYAGDKQLDEQIRDLERAFDTGYGGFGSSQKFPPHSTLLFMLYAAAGREDDASENKLLTMATRTLDNMMERGLHDHLQGGFFRYCVDREWSIPHFEKMLYDQAMCLWVYSLAGALTGSAAYRATAQGVFRSLEETFRIGDLYAAAHDADTDHHEGATYVWTRDEIATVLSSAEFDAFTAVYSISESGSFEGRNHLVRRMSADTVSAQVDETTLHAAERKLLAARRERAQPFRDEKLLTAWNALAGCGLVAAHRYLGLAGTMDRATEIARSLLDGFTGTGHLAHATTGDGVQREEYLTDYASLLHLLTMLDEDTPEFAPEIAALTGELMRFRKDERWVESENSDFRMVAAESFDSPSPSGIALAESVLLRQKVARSEEYRPGSFANPLAHGFANVAALISRGYFHVVENPEPVEWDNLPVNSMQIRGKQSVTCYKGVCFRGLPGGKR